PSRIVSTSPSLLVSVLAVFAAGCNRGKAQETTAETIASASASAASSASAAAAETSPLKVAFAYVAPVGNAGWTFAHDLGRKAVEAEFGDKVKTTFVENVPEAADAERVMRDL